MNGSIADKLGFSLNVSFVAMAIVFGILIILWFVIKSQSFLLGAKKDKAPEKKADLILTKSQQNEDVEVLQDIDMNKDCEIVAAIIAALSAQLNTSAGELNIKSIKRVNTLSNWQRNSIEDKLNN